MVFSHMLIKCTIGFQLENEYTLFLVISSGNSSFLGRWSKTQLLPSGCSQSSQKSYKGLMATLCLTKQLEEFIEEVIWIRLEESVKGQAGKKRKDILIREPACTKDTKLCKGDYKPRSWLARTHITQYASHWFHFIHIFWFKLKKCLKIHFIFPNNYCNTV